MSQINTGGKYNDDVFQFSVGLNGVGTKAVNALSSDFEVRSVRDGKFKQANFVRGKLKKEKSGKSDEPTGTYIRFTPDVEIFDDFAWHKEFIEHRLRYYAYLNSGLKLSYNRETFQSKNGLKDLLADELGEAQPLYEIAHRDGDRFELAFTHGNAYGESYFSFVNGQYTNDGGSHQSAFREGLLKGVNEFANKSYAGEDVRDGIVAAIAVKLQDPVFESQTKNKLGSSDVRSWLVPAVKDKVIRWLHENQNAHSVDGLIDAPRWASPTGTGCAASYFQSSSASTTSTPILRSLGNSGFAGFSANNLLLLLNATTAKTAA